MANNGPQDITGLNHEEITPTVHDEWKALGIVLLKMIIDGERPTDSSGNPVNAGKIEVLQDYLNAQAKEHQDDKTRNAITFPDRLDTFRIEQADWEEFVLRLPAWQVAAVGHLRVCTSNNDPAGKEPYNEPVFYKQFVNKDGNPDIHECEFFLSRVTDYTMSMCK